ncbi:MAG TPA: TMEM175 family protein [Chitinophagaceae bacterium]
MAEPNPYSGLEAFCDGVFAIALTLLIIGIKILSTAEIWLIHGINIKHEE